MISTPPSEANAATAARTPTRRLRNFLPMNSLSPLIATGISPALDRPKFHKRNTIPVTAMSKTRKRMINTFQTSSPAGQPSSRDEIIASGRRGGLGVQAGGRARRVPDRTVNRGDSRSLTDRQARRRPAQPAERGRRIRRRPLLVPVSQGRACRGSRTAWCGWPVGASRVRLPGAGAATGSSGPRLPGTRCPAHWGAEDG